MKIIMWEKPDAVEVVLGDLNENDFVEDPETYYYFRDEVFIREIKEYINDKHPGKLQTKSSDELPMMQYVKIIGKCYPKFNKKRKKFYLYEGEIYSYEYLGLLNIGNEIQLARYDKGDLVQMLNQK